MTYVRLKEISYPRNAKLVAFEDLITGDVLIADPKTIYNLYHNQKVEIWSRMPSNKF